MIPLMRSTFLRERETIAALTEWLATGPSRLSMDIKCAEFEEAFGAWQGRRHAVLFNSGASANLAVMQALKNLHFQAGSRVGFSALTWATNVMPLMQLGYQPVPVDVDPCTLNVMSYTLEDVLPTLDAVFITNALGYLPDLNHIRDACDRAGVLLLEDNCESLGSELPSGRAGNFGKASTFSFFVAHHMSTIEGGMVCTDDSQLDEMLRMVRANGWDRNLAPDQQERWRTRYDIRDSFEAAYTFYVPAYNLRPTEITGFLGLQQLDYLEENIQTRLAYYQLLERAATGNPDIVSLEHSHMSRLSPFAFPVLCWTPELREEYRRIFERAGVEVRPIIAGNLVRQPFYQGWPGADLPGADRVQACGLYFGIYPDLTADDLDVLQSCLAQAA